jgi:hypothetical protein
LYEIFSKNYRGENEATLKLLNDKQIIKNNMKKQQRNEVEDNSYVLKPISHKDALKTTITLHNFLLQYENTKLKLLNALRKSLR